MDEKADVLDNLQSDNSIIDNLRSAGVIDAQSYIKIQELGSGKYGSVYLVKDVTTDRELVMKSMEKASTPKRIYNQELSVLKYLQHICDPYFLCFEHAYETDTNYYILTGYLENHITLAEYFKHQETVGASKKQIKKIILQLVNAISELHSHHIVHRDLKPENILVSKIDYSVRLIDFGFACYGDDTHDQITPCHKVAVGTFDYMSPELMRKMAKRKAITVDEMYASDLWALGVIIYELISGKSLMVSYGELFLDKLMKDNVVEYTRIVEAKTYYKAIYRDFLLQFNFGQKDNLTEELDRTVLRRFAKLNLPFQLTDLLDRNVETRHLH